MRHFFLLQIFGLLILSSCAGLRNANDNQNKINLVDTNIISLAGRYEVSAKDTLREKKASLSWNIFDKGYNPKSNHYFIEIEIQSSRQIKVSYWDSVTLIKSKVFKGRLKKGYFNFKRRYLIIPAIVTNLYRNRAFRIGLLPDKSLITDYNQVSLGTFYVILPYLDRKKEYAVEFKRIE